MELSPLSLFRIKSVDGIISDSEKAANKLKRTLTWLDLIFLGIGAIVGAGIFATIGTAVAGDGERLGAGPALMLSFVLTAVGCGFSALCYAEFAAMVPIAGSAYTYSYATLGEIIAWIIGWDLIIEYAIGNVAVAVSWSGYFCELLAGFNIHLSKWMTIDYRTAFAKDNAMATATRMVENGLAFVGIPHSFSLYSPSIAGSAPSLFGVPIIFNFPAVAIVALLTVLIVIGIKESARFNEIMVSIKLIVLAFFCVVGYFYVRPDNFVPFAPNGFSGILSGAAIVFFAYIGFDAVSTLAEETKDPGKDLPIGIVGSLIICTIIYVLVTAVFVGIMPFSGLQHMLASEKAEPLTMALKYIGGIADPASFTKKFMNYAAGFVAFGSVVAHTAVLLVFQIGQPRIFFSMSRDGLLPPIFSSVHPRFKTPYFSTIITGVFVAGFAAFMNIDEMVDLCNIGTLFAFMLVCVGIMVLRMREPNRPRPFAVPSGPLVKGIGLAASLAIFYYFSVTAVASYPNLPWTLLSPMMLFVFVPVAYAIMEFDGAVPLLGVAACAMLTFGLPAVTWKRFGLWLLVGLVIYFMYGRRNSRLLPENAARYEKEQAELLKLEDADKF